MCVFGKGDLDNGSQGQRVGIVLHAWKGLAWLVNDTSVLCLDLINGWEYSVLVGTQLYGRKLAWHKLGATGMRDMFIPCVRWDLCERFEHRRGWPTQVLGRRPLAHRSMIKMNHGCWLMKDVGPKKTMDSHCQVKWWKGDVTSNKSEAPSTWEHGWWPNHKVFTRNIKSYHGLDLNEITDILYELSREP